MTFFPIHVSKHSEEIKLGEIQADDRLSDPKLITHKQMFPKMLLLRVINSSCYFPNPTFRLYLLKDQAIAQPFLWAPPINMEGEQQFSQIFGNA